MFSNYFETRILQLIAAALSLCFSKFNWMLKQRRKNFSQCLRVFFVLLVTGISIHLLR